MKRTIIVILILIIAATAAFFWVEIDEALLKKSHPLEYGEVVENASKEYSVPKELVYAVIKTESSFKSDAKSHKGAIGLMQITPETYTWLCEKNKVTDVDTDRLYKPEENIIYGTMYLDYLYSRFENWENALAAYNAGPTKVSEWIDEGRIDEYGVLNDIPYKETREYVEKVIKARDTYTQLYFSEENQFMTDIERMD